MAIVRHTMISTNKRGGMLGLSVDEANSLANWVYLIAGAIAVAATTTALVASWVMWRTSTDISEEKDRQLARFRAEASERTATLEKEAAKANERAAEAYKAAEIERVERIKLEIKIAPRTLGEDGKMILSKIILLSGVDIDIVAYEYLGVDIAPLSHQIESALEAAGAKPAIFAPQPGSGFVQGILVRVATDASTEIKNGASELVRALKAAGLAAGMWQPFAPDERIASAYSVPKGKEPNHKIRLLIGTKP